MTDIAALLDADLPPKDLGPAQRALWFIAKGGFVTGPEWEKAHEICQDREGHAIFDRIHGLTHLIEGDRANAAYWYRRAGSAFPGDIRTEWAAIAAAL